MAKLAGDGVNLEVAVAVVRYMLGNIRRRAPTTVQRFFASGSDRELKHAEEFASHFSSH